ncbi:hypothetical protein KFU94_09375 [Chloroflexi bacterium TSY]|nr:hypothetical protein [Chloroflexi bacterium TSY]
MTPKSLQSRLKIAKNAKFGSTESAVDQIFEESMEFMVNGELVASSTDSIYLRYPNEFELLVRSSSAHWEIAGSYNDWDLDAPLLGTNEINRPLCILRKRAE